MSLPKHAFHHCCGYRKALKKHDPKCPARIPVMVHMEARDWVEVEHTLSMELKRMQGIGLITDGLEDALRKISKAIHHVNPDRHR